MKGIMISDEYTKPHERDYWAQATQIVSLLPEMEPGTDTRLRCHEVARIVGRLLGLPVIDGHYGRVEHSWLYYYVRRGGESGTGYQRLLDVYSVGQFPLVRLIGLEWSLPHADDYSPGYPRGDIREDVIEALLEEVRAQLDESQPQEQGS